MGVLTPQKVANVIYQGSFSLVCLKSPCYNSYAGYWHIPHGTGVGRAADRLVSGRDALSTVDSLNRHWEVARGSKRHEP